MVKQLRPYQQECIDSKFDYWANNPGKSSIDVLPTASGKTFIAGKLFERVYHEFPGNQIVFLAHRKELISQTEKTILDAWPDAPIGVYAAGLKRKQIAPIVIASRDTLAPAMKTLSYAPSMALLDECYSSDTEVLTSVGFVKFSDLPADLEVAQYDQESCEISWTIPVEYIERKYKGEMISIFSKRSVDLLVTPGHETLRYRIKTGEPSKESAEKSCFNCNYKMAVAGSQAGIDESIPDWLRFKIMYQADGSHHYTSSTGYRYAFSFSKQRKIDRFLMICDSLNYDVRESNNNAEDKGNVKARRRFIVYTSDIYEKNLDFGFLPSLTAGMAQEFIHEVSKWDGHVFKHNEGMLYYSSISDEAVTRIQEVCVIAGYKATRSIQVDNRSKNYNDVHRIHIDTKTNKVGCSSVNKKTVDYDGTVYCVTVPKGNIVVRRNGKVTVCGNCHNVSQHEDTRYRKLIKEFRARNRYFGLNGTTATPFRHNHGYIYGPGEVFDDVSYQVRMRTMLDNRWLAPLTTPAVSLDAVVDTTGLKFNANGMFNEQQLAARAINYELISAAIDEWIKHAVEKGRRYSLFFCVNVKHAEAVQAELAMRGFSFPLITGNTDPVYRDRVCDEFVHGMHAGILNVGVFTEGTDFPLIDCIVNLRSVRSLPLWLQMAGRGMRISPETLKEDCLMLDMGGCLDHFGPIDTATPPSKGEPDKRTKTCPECDLVVGYLKRKCACGFEFEPPLMKLCSECGEECAPSAAECAACGYIFFKHEKNASTANAISGRDRFVRHPISENVRFLSKTSRKTGARYLQLQYTSGTQVFNHNMHIGAEGVAGHKALEHWKNAVYQYVPVPESLDDALRLLGSDTSGGPGTVFVKKADEPKESPALRGVASIVVDSKSEYKNISVFTYYQRPEDED